MACCTRAAIAPAVLIQKGCEMSPAEKNFFLMPWLATSLKQRLLWCEMAPDIEWLLKQGRQLGVNAQLASKLNYLWHSCTGELSEQNDLFRLNHALETAKAMSWNYRVLSDREWSGRNAVALNASVNGIYLSRSSLDAAFDDDGRQINPLIARLTGNVPGLVKLFIRSDWQVLPDDAASLTYQHLLIAREA
ncbi:MULTISPECIES: DUF2913 family protein [Klebsiella]|uniref:DUF2913 family protein n=1 Tax=Klebsiella TaxID=570 RepID=UPI0009BABD2C|nr:MULTISPECIES: DUF2913 family protein [Klebsiella]EIV7933731.1 DUF2913 family protein [Klebsiella pneumoniae]MBX4721461.1 DUF2913 domain-containing protein [Klebsiella pneumoniae]MBX4768741.1 DUF2913 family protein [Klebsiella pneumoniae]MDE4662829.1 DUF2913 family protein [Klebsiella pneumoniae]MDE4673622.1 DUF2913 family protein [Klebsiella pneumoniae]